MLKLRNGKIIIGKSAQSSPITVGPTVFWGYATCILFVYIKSCSHCNLSVLSMSVMGFKKQSLDGGGWVGGVCSIQFCF